MCETLTGQRSSANDLSTGQLGSPGPYIGTSILPSSDRLQRFTVVKSAVPRVSFEVLMSWDGTVSQVVSSGNIPLHSLLGGITFFAFTIRI